MFGLLTFAAALAHDPAPAHDLENCGAAGGQIAINACFKEKFIAADLQMEAAWEALFHEVGPSEGEEPAEDGLWARQLAAQQAFLMYREAHCRSLGLSQAGGSATDMVIYSCLAELTERRAAELTRIPQLF